MSPQPKMKKNLWNKNFQNKSNHKSSEMIPLFKNEVKERISFSPSAKSKPLRLSSCKKLPEIWDKYGTTQKVSNFYSIFFSLSHLEPSLVLKWKIKAGFQRLKEQNLNIKCKIFLLKNYLLKNFRFKPTTKRVCSPPNEL